MRGYRAEAEGRHSDAGAGCRRCGTCCRKGGPAFHLADKVLIEKGVIPAGSVYAIRKGEPVWDNVQETMQFAPSEIIKIKGRSDSWTCCFFDPEENRCRIYDNRPLECRLLKCWDTRDLREVYEKERLTRKDLLAGMEGIWSLILDHEDRCGYDALGKQVGALKTDQNTETADRILHTVKYDRHLRLLAVEKAGVDPAMTDFLFGRPLLDTIAGFGVKVRRDGEKWILKF